MYGSESQSDFRSVFATPFVSGSAFASHLAFLLSSMFATGLPLLFGLQFGTGSVSEFDSQFVSAKQCRSVFDLGSASHSASAYAFDSRSVKKFDSRFGFGSVSKLC